MNTRRLSNQIISILIAAVLVTTLRLEAQQPPQTTPATGTRTVYDVASIRQNKSDSGITMVRPVGDGLNMTNITLVGLLLNAYGIREELMSGLPVWANTVRFDINAKVSDPDADALKKLSGEQRRAMLIALLNDRLHLQAHIETKTLPVYDLVIAKGGPKLKENAATPATSLDSEKTPSNLKPGSFMIRNSTSNSQMTAVGIPTSNLAANLAFQVERNVIDETGLTGKYDFTLKWTPTELQGKTTGTDDNAPDLFTALQEQLGLKLEPSKGPVDTLVIEHVELPSQN